jgi:hypothetical protein
MGGSVARADVVTRYPMNETGGVLTDVVGGVNQTPVDAGAFTYGAPSVPAGTYGPIVITPAQAPAFGTAVTGTGSSIFLNTAGNNALTNLTSPLTVMAWVNPASTAALQRIFSGSAGDGNGWGWGVLGTSFQRFTTYGVFDFDQNVGTQVQAGAWQHLAVTFDGGTATFYVNGESVDSKSGGNFRPNANETFALFGLPTSAGGNIELFNGTIDEVRVYNTLLTPPEIIAAATVPEPTAAALIAVAAGVVLTRRRRGQ